MKLIIPLAAISLALVKSKAFPNPEEDPALLSNDDQAAYEEDCEEDDVQVAAAYGLEDSFLAEDEIYDEDCEEEPLEIMPAHEEIDMVMPLDLEENTGEIDPYYDEECEEEMEADVMADEIIDQKPEVEEYEADCYDEEGDPVDDNFDDVMDMGNMEYADNIFNEAQQALVEDDLFMDKGEEVVEEDCEEDAY